METTHAIRQVITAATGHANGAGTEYRLAADVLLAVVWDGSSRLIDFSGTSYGLPASGTAILEAVLSDGLESAVRQVAGRYTVDPDRVRTDAERFLSDLERLGLLTRPAATGNRNSVWNRLKAWPLAGMLRVALWAYRSDARKAGALLACAWACLKTIGWARTIELWREATGSGADPSTDFVDTTRVESISTAVRDALARSFLPADCKARALCCWAMLRSAGQPARLVVGFDLFPFLGHCWCESGEHVLADGPERCGRFARVLQYS